MVWSLDSTVETSAGRAVAGSAGDGPALILVHSWPWSSFSRHRVVPELANHYRFTAGFEDLLGNIRCPVAVIWGEEDPWTPLSQGREMRELLPGANFQTNPQVAHLPQLEAPLETVQLITNSLKALHN